MEAKYSQQQLQYQQQFYIMVLDNLLRAMPITLSFALQYIIQSTIIIKIKALPFQQSMQQLVNLISTRIYDIKQLQSLTSDVQASAHSLHELILRQRNGEEYRNRREMEILGAAGHWACGDEIEGVLGELLGQFDGKVTKYGANGNQKDEKSEARDRIFRMLRAFFTRNSYRQKLSYLKSLFERHSTQIPVSTILILISDWSKHKYLSILSSQIKDIKSRYLIDGGNRSLTKLPQPETNVSRKDSTAALQQKKSTSLLLAQQEPQQKQSIRSVNSSKLLTIYNRVTLYGYMAEELEEYYALTGMRELDWGFLRTVPRRKMKECMGYAENVNRGVQVLIEVSANKDLRNAIREYMERYAVCREEARKQKMRKMEYKTSTTNTHNPSTLPNKNKSVRTMSDHLPSSTREVPTKKLSVQLRMANVKVHSTTTGDEYGVTLDLEQSVASSLLAPGNNERLLGDIKENIRRKLIEKREMDKKEAGSRVKLPQLSRSMQKQQKPQCSEYNPGTKIYRFPTEQQQPHIQPLKQQQIQSSVFKFSQRQTIKGIIIKNFLTNREKQKQKPGKIKQNSNSDIECLFIKNKQEYCGRGCQVRMEEGGRVMGEAMDLRSLRKKTKALLKNFRTIQNY